MLIILSRWIQAVTNSGQTNLLSSPLPPSFICLHLDLTGPLTRVDPDLTPTLVLPYMLPVGLSQLYMYQHIFQLSSQPQFCHVCCLSACPTLHASTIFPIIWPTLVLTCVSSVGLSQLYRHQQIFYSSSQPQFCHICYLLAYPSFTCINNISNHPADPSFAMCFICRPVPILQASTNFPVGRPTPVLQYYWSSACPRFTGLNQFSHPPANPSFAMFVTCWLVPLLH